MVEEKVAWAEIAQHFNRRVKKCKNKLKRVQAKPVKIEKIKKAIQEQTIAPKKNIDVFIKYILFPFGTTAILYHLYVDILILYMNSYRCIYISTIYKSKFSDIQRK